VTFTKFSDRFIIGIVMVVDFIAKVVVVYCESFLGLQAFTTAMMNKKEKAKKKYVKYIFFNL